MLTDNSKLSSVCEDIFTKCDKLVSANNGVKME